MTWATERMAWRLGTPIRCEEIREAVVLGAVCSRKGGESKQELAKLAPAVTCKVENVQLSPGYLAEEVSRKNVEGISSLLLAAYTTM